LAGYLSRVPYPLTVRMMHLVQRSMAPRDDLSALAEVFSGGLLEERDFPPAFLRRCLELDIAPPDEAALIEIVKSHLGLAADAELDATYRAIIDAFHARRETRDNELPTDRLLHAIFLAWKHVDIDQRIERGEPPKDKDALIDCLWPGETS
jgi:MoxR-like ATPase